MSIEIACYNFKCVGFMLKDKSKILEMKKYVLKSCAFPVLVQGAEKPTRSHSGEGKVYAPVLCAEDGTENAAIFVERQ